MKKLLTIVLAIGLTCSALGGCKKATEEEVTVYVPDGAPALALTKLMKEDTEEDGVIYKVVAPSLISSKVTNKNEEENADLCVLPFTAATKLLGEGTRYTMLGTLTHGNLYLVAKEGEITSETISALTGKNIGVLQMNEVPGLTLKVTLKKYGIAYQEVKNDGGMVEDKVNLTAISGADAVGTIPADYYLLAEPAASAQAKKGYTIVGDLQALYGGEEGYPQAVLVAKNSLIEEKSVWLEEFVSKVEGSATWLSDADGEELVSIISAHLEDQTAESSLKAPLLTREALGRCGIRFTYASEGSEARKAFLSALLEVNPQAAAIPLDRFYWEKE